MFNKRHPQVTPAGVVSTLAGTAGVLAALTAPGRLAVSFSHAASSPTARAMSMWPIPATHHPQDHTRRRSEHARRTAGAAGSADATGTAAKLSFPARHRQHPLCPVNHRQGRGDHSQLTRCIGQVGCWRMPRGKRKLAAVPVASALPAAPSRTGELLTTPAGVICGWCGLLVSAT